MTDNNMSPAKARRATIRRTTASVAICQRTELHQIERDGQQEYGEHIAHRKGSDRLVTRILRNEYVPPFSKGCLASFSEKIPLPSKIQKLRPSASVGGSEYPHRPACRDCRHLAHGRQPVIRL